jgi:hypothetical protein
MRLLWAVAALALLSSGLARADNDKGDKVDLAVGRGIICNTSNQAERYVALRNEGAENVKAIQTVNEEAKNPQACGEAIVAITQGEAMTETRIQGKPVTIMKLTIVAFNDGQQWARIPETVQYTVIEAPGINV